MMSSNTTMNIAKGIITGVVIGGTAAAVIAKSSKPKKSKFRRTAVHALDTMGTIMQSMADYAR